MTFTGPEAIPVRDISWLAYSLNKFKCRCQVYVLDIHLVRGIYHFWEVLNSRPLIMEIHSGNTNRNFLGPLGQFRSGSIAGSRGVGQLLNTSNKEDYL